MLQNYQDRIKGNTEQQKKVDFTLGIVANKEKFDLLFCLSSRRTQKSKPRANLKKGIIKESPLQLRWNPKRSLLFGSQVELEINLPLYSANSYCLIVQKIKALYLRKKKKTEQVVSPGTLQKQIQILYRERCLHPKAQIIHENILMTMSSPQSRITKHRK